jgi:hypothetical protein
MQGRRERIRVRVKKKFFVPHTSKGGLPTNLYSKSERLSFPQWLEFGLKVLICTIGK